MLKYNNQSLRAWKIHDWERNQRK